MKKIIIYSLIFLSNANIIYATNFNDWLGLGVKNGDYNLVVKAVENGANIELKDSILNATPLAWASYYGDAAIVEYLVKKGANLESKEKSGLTPLLNAAINGNAKVAELLLSAGANVNAISSTNETALHIAAKRDYQNSHKDLIKSILSYKPNKELKDINGQTPYELAINLNKKSIANIIQNKDAEEEIDLDNINDMREYLTKLNLPAETYAHINEKLKLLETGQGHHEAGAIKKYLQTVFSLPWNKTTVENLDIAKAKDILDRDHSGLKEIKEKILDFIAVKQLKTDGYNPIICFVGPPGIGKTSLVQSIANSLNRKYTRISLGGMRDVSELKGHSMTYIGALPGQIVQSFIKVKSKNPVILLDEIDKMATGNVYGDPTAAMLEILDPNQNKAFHDDYLGITFDLSNTMFIATANNLANIPIPLRDRMLIIELAGYTVDEKIEIAQNYLVKKAKLETGLEKEPLTFDTDLIKYIIENYTHEAGVRELERIFKNLCSKVARSLVENKKTIDFNVGNISNYLGQPYLKDIEDTDKNEIGITNGLAWTSLGGNLLKVEAILMPGNGKLILTGSLGKVMKESAKAALSYIRANANKLGIDPEIFTKNDLHIHFPAGGSPKDGPSAGAALITSIISALTNRKVNSAYAMTGEINLRGNIMPIGGLKEKVLAAKRNKIAHVFAPKLNKNDLVDQPNITKDIDIIWVDHISQVIDKILVS